MKVTSRLAIGGAAVTAAGLVGAAVAGAVSIRRWRRRPDPAIHDALTEADRTRHRMVPTSDGGAIHVLERGEGRPFLLLHGVTETSLVWHYQLLDLVEAGYRVVAMDIRGHGRSTAGSDGYSLVAMARDTYEVIEALALRQSIAVGHSMGAMVLLQLLADHAELVPEAIASLALVATSASPVLGNGVPAAAAQMVRVLSPIAGRGHVRASAGVAGRMRPPGDAAAVYCRLAFGANPSPTHVEFLRAMTSAVPAPIVAELVVTLLSLDVRATLPAIKAPTLVVTGSRDLLTPVWHARYTASHIPVAELHVLAGCGHMVMFERRVELAQLLVDFAERTEPVPRSGADGR